MKLYTIVWCNKASKAALTRLMPPVPTCWGTWSHSPAAASFALLSYLLFMRTM